MKFLAKKIFINFESEKVYVAAITPILSRSKEVPSGGIVDQQKVIPSYVQLTALLISELVMDVG